MPVARTMPTTHSLGRLSLVGGCVQDSSDETIALAIS